MKRINKITPLAETKFLNLYDAEYINKLGRVKHWTIASRKDINTLNNQLFENKEERVDAVVIAAIHSSLDKLVLIRQYRVPINDYIYELPAGLIDSGEDIYNAIERELFEETGLKLISIDESMAMQPTYVSAGMTDESIVLAFCKCDGYPSIENLEEDEDLEVILLSREAGMELLKKGAKFDTKAFIILQNFCSSK